MCSRKIHLCSPRTEAGRALGTAPLAQIAVVLLVAHISSTILLSTPVSLFTAHPLLNAFALLMLTQSLLLLQPTHTAEQKRSGALLHALLNLLAFLAFVAALAIILANKFAHHGVHFASAHARLGLLTYIYLLLQAAVGASMYFLPAVYGGEERAKKIWKWHRASGYLALLLVLGTVLAACWTDFNVNVLGVKVWAVIVCEVFIILGIGARIRLVKLGWTQTQT